MDRRSRSSPTRVVKKSFTSCRRMVRSRRNRSPAAAPQCVTRRSGRLMESESHSATRTESSTSSHWPIARVVEDCGFASRADSRLHVVAARKLPRVHAWRTQNQFSSVYIWSATDDQVASRNRRLLQLLQPGVGSAGQLSLLPERREFAPQISNIEFNYATNRPTYIYAMALRKDVKHPFPPESDEVTVAKPDECDRRPAALHRRA